MLEVHQERLAVVVSPIFVLFTQRTSMLSLLSCPVFQEMRPALRPPVGLFFNIDPLSNSSSSEMCAGLKMEPIYLFLHLIHTCAYRRSMHTCYHMVQTQVIVDFENLVFVAVIEWPFFSIQLHWECASVFAYRSRCLLCNGKNNK